MIWDSKILFQVVEKRKKIKKKVLNRKKSLVLNN
jgi:hypothetical protein